MLVTKLMKEEDNNKIVKKALIKIITLANIWIKIKSIEGVSTAERDYYRPIYNTYQRIDINSKNYSK